MSNIKKEIESLKAKIARLENEQKKAEIVKKALASANTQIDKILKDNGINFEAYIRHKSKTTRRAGGMMKAPGGGYVRVQPISSAPG
ncbi:MAG: hypothetical protein N0E45_12275, partial [Candidatus Thiodiazotropha endolucinida]|nr:hypothetical protein [Candidatus Thiodiazotropha taylori]MCW4300411.1 hypothetical protein [Candidatus Thiodiazotropha endolucinida]